MRVRPNPAVGRLLKRSEFLAAARGRRFHTERMSVQGLRRTGSGETGAGLGPGTGLRLGFTITKKVGHATERNRIRRRLRAAAAEAASPFAADAVDVVVIGRRDAYAAPFETLIDDLSRALATVTKPPRSERGPRAPRDASSPIPHA